ncbi:hypothetical protein GC194_09300 [bacterium]|nr:hypothetical protein [bacterium]
MKDSKLFEALQTLDKKGFQRFLKFMRSPYIQENQLMLMFCDLLEAEYPDISAENLSRQRISDSVFIGEPYEDVRVRRLMSEMLKLFDEFVALEKFREDDVYAEINKLAYYREHELGKHFKAIDTHVRGQMAKKGVYGSEEDYYKSFLLERELNQFLSEKGERKGTTHVTNASLALDQFFILQKLRYGCMQANYGKVFSQSYQLFLLDEIVSYVGGLDFKSSPLINAYYLALMMFKHPDDSMFFSELHALLKRDGNKFAFQSQIELYRFVQNYCIGKINKGEKQYRDELLNIYEETLTNKVAFIGGELSHVAFMNIVSLGCSLEKFAWVENFISDYSSFINEKRRASSVAINMALLNWYKKKYSDAVRLLSRVEFEEPFFALNAKSLLLKIYFEQDEKDVLLSFCESFKMYLTRNNLISKTHINNYMNLIYFTSKLIKIKPTQVEKFNKIKNEIIRSKALSNRQWLLEQVGKMERDYIEIPD